MEVTAGAQASPASASEPVATEKYCLQIASGSKDQPLPGITFLDGQTIDFPPAQPGVQRRSLMSSLTARATHPESAAHFLLTLQVATRIVSNFVGNGYASAVGFLSVS